MAQIMRAWMKAIQPLGVGRCSIAEFGFGSFTTGSNRRKVGPCPLVLQKRKVSVCCDSRGKLMVPPVMMEEPRFSFPS